MGHSVKCELALGKTCICRCHNTLHGLRITNAFVKLASAEIKAAIDELSKKNPYVGKRSFNNHTKISPADREAIIESIVATVIVEVLSKKSTNGELVLLDGQFDPLKDLAKALSEDVFEELTKNKKQIAKFPKKIQGISGAYF